MRNQRLQGRITAGRFTLPIVIFTCIACWVLTSVLLPGLEVKESSYPLWNIVNIPAWANRIVSFLLFAGIGYFLIELNNTFAIIRMRASVQTSLYFLLITACPGMHLSHFALFPVQKLSAASSCRLSVPFVCFAERRQCGVSSADVLHPHLADGCIRFSVAHVPQFLRCHNRLEHPLLVLIGTCLFSQRNRAFLPTVHPSGRLPGH